MKLLKSKRAVLALSTLYLFPLGIVVTSNLNPSAGLLLAEAEFDCQGKIDRLPATANTDKATAAFTEEDIKKLKFQAEKCHKNKEELDVAQNALDQLFELGELSAKEAKKISKKIDYKKASLLLKDLRKSVEETDDRGELDELLAELMELAADSDFRAALRDESNSGSDKLAELARDIAHKSAELLEPTASNRHNVLVSRLNKALKIKGVSTSLRGEISGEVFNLEQSRLASLTQRGWNTNFDAQLMYNQMISGLQAQQMQSCYGAAQTSVLGIPVMSVGVMMPTTESTANCAQTQSRIQMLQLMPMVGKQADLQTAKLQQQQKLTLAKNEAQQRIEQTKQELELRKQQYEMDAELKKLEADLYKQSGISANTYDPYVNPWVSQGLPPGGHGPVQF